VLPMGHARLALALVAGLDPRFLGRVVDRLAGAPRIEETELGGVPATLATPGRGPGPWPGVLVYPGITARGRAHPGHQGVARGLAAAGFACAVAEPAGLARGVVSPRTLDELGTAATAFARHAAVRSGGFAVAGVSGGATLALLAAGASPVAGDIRAVLALAPLCDFRLILRAVSTGTIPHDGRSRPFAPEPLIRVVTGRSMVSCLPPGADREALLGHLLALDDYEPMPYAGLRESQGPSLGAPARALVELLVNEDEARFDELFAALDPSTRAHVAQLSPLTHAAWIRCPCDLVVPPDDKYIPLDDHIAFVRACPPARLVITPALSHVIPRASRAGAVGLTRLERAVAQFLTRALGQG
jgi:hypothetical protein